MMSFILRITLCLLLIGCAKDKKGQNPSPMQEHIRPHERVDGSDCEGVRFNISDVFDVPLEVFIPSKIADKDTADLVIHFYGNRMVTEYAACNNDNKLIIITINFGSGSERNERPLQGSNKFIEFLEHLQSQIEMQGIVLDRIFVSGFSAGFGAIRAILSNKTYCELIEGVLLLDGLHTDYIPKGKVLAQGGLLNISKLQPFLDFADLALSENKRFIFTHSSIFPGTFASTTECADYLIAELDLSRQPSLVQGPLGMQQVGSTEKGGLRILAFAGNTAPDHIDHLHSFYHFLQLLLQ